MGIQNIYAAGGRIIGQDLPDGQRVDFLRDALGSVTGTVNGMGAVEDTFRYKPHGSVLSSTGVGAPPAFQWNGTSGYMATGLSFSEQYVRRRHYSSTTGSWSTKDLFWPDEKPYSYAFGRVTTFADPTGHSISWSGDSNTAYDCGYSSYVIQLKWSPSDTGYLIQHIYDSYDYGDCENVEKDPCSACLIYGYVPPYIEDYWEAWELSGNELKGCKNHIEVGPYDRFTEANQGQCTNGDAEIMGYYTLVSDLTWRTYPAGTFVCGDLKQAGAIACAQALYSSEFGPPKWVDQGRKHFSITHHQCCCSSDSNSCKTCPAGQGVGAYDLGSCKSDSLSSSPIPNDVSCAKGDKTVKPADIKACVT